MNTLVIGGTGTVGSEVVRQLVAQTGIEVSVMTRDADKSKNVPPEAVGTVGDLRDPYAARSSFRGVDAVFMLNGASVSEAYEGLMGVLLARQAGVKRFVYMSTHRADLTPFLPIGGGTKLSIENALKVSGIPYTILRPNNFFQNDRWYKDSMIEQGIYPQPIGLVGMQRVDVRDIAEAAVLALTSAGHEGKTYNLIGPRVETGPSSAEAWTDALHTAIKYGGNDLEVFERTHMFMGPSLVFAYRNFYEFYQQHGLVGTADDLQTMTELLGHPPRSLREFAKETAEHWAVTSA